MATGREIEELGALVERAERGDADAVTALIGDRALPARLRSAGGELAFRAAVVGLAHVLAHPAAYPDEVARERYSALCDEHGADPARMARLKPLGEQLHALERDGVLPRSMVVRSRRRRD